MEERVVTGDGRVVKRYHIHDWEVIEDSRGLPAFVVCDNELCKEQYSVGKRKSPDESPNESLNESLKSPGGP